MAKPQQSIIIKKVQGGGHGGHHGGAWKVAYADFVTAMMAFFMVMWLMGSDEETKAAIEQYFNNPTSSWRKDLNSDNIPLGDMTGAGDSILNGLDGGVAEDMVQRPARMVKGESAKADKSPLDTLMDESNPIKPESIRLSIREDQVFREGTLNQWTPAAEKFLTRLGKIAKMYNGKVAIQGQYDPYSEGDKDTPGTYEHQLTRSVAIERYLIENQYAAEDRIKTQVVAARAERGETRTPSSNEGSPSRARAIEITITQ